MAQDGQRNNPDAEKGDATCHFAKDANRRERGCN
jgi:hypothetical protein